MGEGKNNEKEREPLERERERNWGGAESQDSQLLQRM